MRARARASIERLCSIGSKSPSWSISCVAGSSKEAKDRERASVADQEKIEGFPRAQSVIGDHLEGTQSDGERRGLPAFVLPLVNERVGKFKEAMHLDILISCLLSPLGESGAGIINQFAARVFYGALLYCWD